MFANWSPAFLGTGRFHFGKLLNAIRKLVGFHGNMSLRFFLGPGVWHSGFNERFAANTTIKVLLISTRRMINTGNSTVVCGSS